MADCNWVNGLDWVNGPLRSAREKLQNSGFKHPIADRQHVVAPGNGKGLCAGDERGERLRRARNRVFVADRHQERYCDLPYLVTA